MRILALVLLNLLAASPLIAQAEDDDIIAVFSPSFAPALEASETATIHTNFRGFGLRADSYSAIEQDDPSPKGISLAVAVKGAGPKAERFDKTESHNSFILRTVQIPPRKADDQFIEVEFAYGREVPKQVVSAINACINRLLRDHPPGLTTRSSGRPLRGRR